MLYDAHVHLTDREYEPYIGDVISSLYAMKIVACSVAVDVDTTQRGLRLFSAHADVVRQFAGIHPEFAAKEDLDAFMEIAKGNGRLSGIGEIGLDGTYEAERGVPYERQKQVFNAMLALAESEAKPVSIHSRRTLDDILALLPSYRLKGALLHWFAGSKKQLAKATDMGLYVSYGPTLVYADDKKVLLKNTAKDRFLVETDGPVRYARCFEDKPALPTSFLASVVAQAAATLGLSYNDTAQVLESNAKAFLGS